MGKLAERVRFELTVPVKVQRFSRPSRSTTPAPLRVVAGYSIGKRKRKGRCQNRRSGRTSPRKSSEYQWIVLPGATERLTARLVQEWRPASALRVSGANCWRSIRRRRLRRARTASGLHAFAAAPGCPAHSAEGAASCPCDCRAGSEGCCYSHRHRADVGCRAGPRSHRAESLTDGERRVLRILSINGRARVRRTATAPRPRTIAGPTRKTSACSASQRDHIDSLHARLSA